MVSALVEPYPRRIYPPLDTLCPFVGQALAADRARQDAVGRRLQEPCAQGRSARARFRRTRGMREMARRSCAIVGQSFCSRRLTATPVMRLTSSATPEGQRDVPLLRVKAGVSLSIGIADNPVSTKPSSRVTAVAMPARIAGATTRQKKTPITTSTKADWFASQLKNSGDVSMCPCIRLHKKRAGRPRPM